MVTPEQDAATAGRYYRACVAEGFGHTDALALTMSYITANVMGMARQSQPPIRAAGKPS